MVKKSNTGGPADQPDSAGDQAAKPGPDKNLAAPPEPCDAPAGKTPDKALIKTGAQKEPPENTAVSVPAVRPKRHVHPFVSAWQKAIGSATAIDFGQGKHLNPSRRVRVIGRKFRRQVWRYPWRRFLFLTITPALAVFLYNFLWASPQYVSTAMFAIRTPEQSGGGMGDLAGMFLRGVGGGSVTADSYVVANYVHSWELFSRINDRLDLTGHYSDNKHDFMSRLKKGAPQMSLLDYWKSALKVSYDPDTGITTNEVRAFSPEMAQRINAEVIALSEERVNEMNRQSRRQAIIQAQAEFGLAETRLQKSRLELQAYREQTKIIDPMSAAGAAETTISALEQEAAKTAAELSAELRIKSDINPDVLALRRRLDGINSQLEAERAKLSEFKTEFGRPERMNPALAREFERLYMDEELAKQQYTMAMAALESARIRAESKSSYLVAFQPPILPDEAKYPRVLYSTFITFLGSVFILSLASLIWAAIKEHAGFL